MAIFCTNCGKQIEEGAAFCSACGKAVSQTQPAGTPAAPVAAESAKKKSKAPLIIAGVAVLIIASALVGVFTQGFGLFGDTEETKGSAVSGSVTPAPEDTPPAIPTPEDTPSVTPTPESTPSETPTPEATPTETPDLPPNHISAAFFDLVRNGDSFYLDYFEEWLYLEEEYANGSDPDDLWYHENHYNRMPYQEARQGSLCCYWYRKFGTRTHRIFRDNKMYDINIYPPSQGAADYIKVSDAPPSMTGALSGTFGIPIRGGGVEFAGSGVGAINGVTMTYDIYIETLFGEATGLVYRVYLDGDTVPYMMAYEEGEWMSLYSFSEISLTVPPDKLWLFDVPEDIPIVEGSETPAIPGR